MNVNDGQTFDNLSATPASFPLGGGRYSLVVNAGSWSSGSVQLQTLSRDGSTWINVGSAVSADGVASLELPPGQYQLSITSATGVYAVIARVPS